MPLGHIAKTIFSPSENDIGKIQRYSAVAERYFCYTKVNIKEYIKAPSVEGAVSTAD